MHRICYLLIILLAFQHLRAQPATKHRPKIGLTLSGGGAKGLAHIGILKAIDSAGLKIDYITGTSMGSIIGAMYAVGYKADSIEKIVHTIDWDLLLTNQSSLRSIFMEEKDEYSKYVIELPWVNHNFRLPMGVLEGQELWLKFSELFFPVYNQKDFSKFSIPFRCIGTDVGTGEAVVLKDGEIISAIRSSMAIPSVFTAVEINDKKLIDGGLVRNFPVRDVREMGANYVIGSNVAAGLLPSEKVRNALQILLQVAFFREAEDNKKEIPQCDMYIPLNLEKFNMGSFADANSILELGLEEGRKLYPAFKRVADSLNALYGPDTTAVKALPQVDKVKISSYEVNGVDRTSASFFVHTLNLETGRYYNASQLANMVRQAYGTRYYRRIVYSLVEQEDGSVKIIFDVAESPFAYAKLGLHYNRFLGVGLVGNFTIRNFFVTNSRSLVSINLGESFRIRGEHLQYLGRRKNFALLLETQFDDLDIPFYESAKQIGLYNQGYFKFGERLQFSMKRTNTIGAGHRFEWGRYVPSISALVELKGNNYFNTYYGFFDHNSLDKAIFPKRGVKLHVEAGAVSRQHPDVTIMVSGTPLSDSLTVDKNAYMHAALDVDSYTPLWRRSTLLLTAQGGMNLHYKDNFLNEFIVGGLTKTFRNQITFAGLPEGSLFTTNVLMLQCGLRTQIFNNIYLTAKANALMTNFVNTSNFFKNEGFYSGYALTFAYNFALGPLEISAMYCDQTRKLQSYINLGIPF